VELGGNICSDNVSLLAIAFTCAPLLSFLLKGLCFYHYTLLLGSIQSHLKMTGITKPREKLPAF